MIIKDLDQQLTCESVDIPSIKLKKQSHWDTYWSLLLQTHNELCTAAQNNDLQQLQKLLSPLYEYPIDVNMKLEEQWCCLHFASMEGNYDACQILLNYGANPDVTNVQNRTPLHIASIKGYKEICQLLIEYKANLNIFDYQQNTALHLASQLGHCEIVNLLLDNGSDYKVRNHFNYNAYDLSYNDKITEIFEQRGLFESYSKKSFCGISNRQDHIMKLLKLSDKVSTQISKVKVSKIEIQQIGPQDFSVINQLGKGSFGQVYLVEKKNSNQQFAMKVLMKKKIQAAGIVRYAQTERKVLSIVESPFIVKLHYAFQTENKLYMIMDYCPGGDLEQLMNERGTLPEKAAKVYGTEILLALETLHDNCIVYRDLKPSNVVIDKDGHAMLTDFGLSKELTTQRTISYCGSYAYLAPEMLDKSGHGFPIDWYLYGLFLYELVNGRPPFYQKNRNELFNSIKSDNPQRPENISDTLWDLLQKLLDKNQSQRLGSSGDAKQIKQHPWFNNINWEIVQQRKQPVPKVTLRPEMCDLDLKVTFSEQALQQSHGNFIQDWDY